MINRVSPLVEPLGCVVGYASGPEALLPEPVLGRLVRMGQNQSKIIRVLGPDSFGPLLFAVDFGLFGSLASRPQAP